ncbi:MAG: cytochrome c [Nitrospirales bacterium]|nr:cytochrome c [Nitrospira sp.]MDR4501809.1 cytochrome c [Nitrospirales bacterium]
MKTWIISVSIGILILLLLTSWLLPGAFSAKGKPSELEVTLARLARHWATPSQYRNASNPVQSGPDVLADALHHFADHCSTCHANDGSGKTAMGPNFYPPVPDLRDEVIQSMSDGELFYVIHFGVRFTGMPAWGDGNPDKDLDSWGLVHFIRRLPNITPDEIKTMKTYNPKTQAEREKEEAFDRFMAGEDFEPTDDHHH